MYLKKQGRLQKNKFRATSYIFLYASYKNRLPIIGS